MQTDSIVQNLPADSVGTVINTIDPDKGILFRKFIDISLNDFGEIGISISRVIIIVLLLLAVLF